MKNIYTGGQAFPQAIANEIIEPGMTLRDYFAGQALIGLCSNKNYEDMTDEQVSKACYINADTMIKERNQSCGVHQHMKKN